MRPRSIYVRRCNAGDRYNSLVRVTVTVGSVSNWYVRAPGSRLNTYSLGLNILYRYIYSIFI